MMGECSERVPLLSFDSLQKWYRYSSAADNPVPLENGRVVLSVFQENSHGNEGAARSTVWQWWTRYRGWRRIVALFICDLWSYRLCWKRCSLWRKVAAILMIILFLFQLAGIYPLVLYCLRTYTCGIHEKHPHYHCQTRPKIMSLGHKGDKSFELAFAISEVLSRSIFLLFCCKSLKKRNKSPCRIFWRQFKLSQTWILFGTWFLCEVRFIAILTDPKDLGQHKNITKATIVIYMFDALLTSLLVTFLNYVTLRDLAEDTVREDNERFVHIRVRVCKTFKYLLKCVLFSFWLQYFVYFFLVLFEIVFDVFDADKEVVGENNQKVFSVLKTAGQSAFMAKISGYLFSKFCDDHECILGTRTNETEPSTQQQAPRGSFSNERIDVING